MLVSYHLSMINIHIYDRGLDYGDVLILLEPQSHFGDKKLKSRVVRPQNGTAVLKVNSGAITAAT